MKNKGAKPMSQKKVREFHEKFGLVVQDQPAFPDDKTVALRQSLIAEEAGEVLAAIDARDMVATADGLADLLYVVYGTAVSFGINIEEIFDEVHRSNMKKEGG